MKKIILYGSPHCPPCGVMKEKLEEHGIKYAYEEITGSMGALKRFLALRDSRPEFEAAKAKGNVGVPCLMVEDVLYFEFPEDPEILK